MDQLCMDQLGMAHRRPHDYITNSSCKLTRNPFHDMLNFTSKPETLKPFSTLHTKSPVLAGAAAGAQAQRERGQQLCQPADGSGRDRRFRCCVGPVREHHGRSSALLAAAQPDRQRCWQDVQLKNLFGGLSICLFCTLVFRGAGHRLILGLCWVLATPSIYRPQVTWCLLYIFAVRLGRLEMV